MATMRHTPRGRGYDLAVHYFHHMEDYWQSVFQNGNGDTDFFGGALSRNQIWDTKSLLFLIVLVSRF
eukprot:SAG31_NODE_4869_length_2877_cov_1.648446_5_plen_67_part_00